MTVHVRAEAGPVGRALSAGSAQHLQTLVEEREPSLLELMNERDPRFYTPLSEMLERRVMQLLRERDGVQ